jgi:type I restriction enzyme S subunit
MKHRWPITKLGEVLTERRETPKDNDLASGRVRIIEKISFDSGRIQLRVDGLTKTGMILVRPGDLVVSGINAAKGAMAIYDAAESEPVAATIHYGSYETNPRRGDVRFLWWMLRSRFFQELLLEYVPGGIKTELKAKRLLPVPVPLPPLAEQQRVVSLIEELAEQIHEGRTLRHQAAEEADVLASRSRAVRFAELENDFSTRPLGELISMASGEGLTSSQMDDSAPYPVYGGGGFNGRYTRFLFEEPKIVIGRVGARCGCVFVTEPKAWVTDNALYLTEISDELDSSYLVHALTTLDLRQQANQAAQPVVSQKKINPMRIPVPSLTEQRRIVAELDALQAGVDALKRLQAETAAELNALLPAILDKAFKGEL